MFVQAFEPGLHTPRLAKRYANVLTFALPLLKGEVNTLDLMFIEAVHAFYPRLYSAIRDNPNVFLGTDLDRRGEQAKQYATSVIDDALEELSESDKRAAEKIIQELFPRTGVRTVMGNVQYGAEWDSTWAKEKRIAAQRYFHRYFALGIPPEDVSDRVLDDFLDSIPGSEIDAVVRKIRELATMNRAGLLIEKLRRREDTLPPNAAAGLALALSLCGDAFPQDQGFYGVFGASSFSQAAMLIRHLVKRINDQEAREKLALTIADSATQLPFAVEYRRWIRNLKRSSDADNVNSVVSIACEKKIDEQIVTRVVREAREKPIEERYPNEASTIYQFWRWFGEASLRSYLEERFRSNPPTVVQFLYSATKHAWSMDSGLSFRMNLERDEYNSIASMVDPEIIISALQITYPELDLSTATFNEDGEVTKDNVALAFTSLHQQALREANESQASTNATN